MAAARRNQPSRTGLLLLDSRSPLSRGLSPRELAQEGGDLEVPVLFGLEDTRLVGLDAPQHAEQELCHVTTPCNRYGIRDCHRWRTFPAVQHLYPPRVSTFLAYTHDMYEWCQNRKKSSWSDAPDPYGSGTLSL